MLLMCQPLFWVHSLISLVLLSIFYRWGNWGPRSLIWLMAEQQSVCLENPKVNYHSIAQRERKGLYRCATLLLEDNKERLDQAGISKAKALPRWVGGNLTSLLGILELHKSSRILWLPQYEKSPSDHQSLLKSTEMLHQVKIYGLYVGDTLTDTGLSCKGVLLFHIRSLQAGSPWSVQSFLMSPSIQDISVLTFCDPQCADFYPSVCFFMVTKCLPELQRSQKASSGQKADAEHLEFLPRLPPRPFG